MAENDEGPGGTDRPDSAPEPAAADAPEEPTPTASQPVIPPEPAAAPVLKTRWRGPHQFKDGGPRWHWDDDDMMPGQPLTPYGQPSPTTPSPSPGSTG